MSKMKQEERKDSRNLWIWGICVHILTFTFVLDLYFTSPINHGMTPHKTLGEPFAKRVVVIIADGLRAESIYPQKNWNRVEYLSDLRLNKSCSWGVVNTGVPTESRPGHVAIFAGLMEDPSAILTGWQANIVEFDSVINESNYAWSYGSPDIVKIFTKEDKMKLTVDYYDPDQEDFSGRTSTENLDTWVFNKVEELLTPAGNSCEALMIRKRRQRRRIQELHQELAVERARCNALLENCEAGASYRDCYARTQPCRSALTSRQIEATVNEAEVDLETLELLPCLKGYDKIASRQLGAQGNVFFFHLLGMDTAGHVHKPDSSEYLENLRVVDKGVRETELLFNEFFNDDATTFLFTADHGMTNWGSHGDGTDHETEVPYILWGKGVKYNKMRQDLKQTDLAPLIASLIGIPIPINSVGILPHKLLNGSYNQIAEAVLANVMQHVEQYKLLLREFEFDSFFTEFPAFRDGYVDRTVRTMRELLKDGDSERMVVRLGEELMRETLLANAYMAQYYMKPKVITLMLGFVLWIVYLSLTVHVKDEKIMKSSRRSLRIGAVVLMFVTCIYLKGLHVKYFTYLYPTFLLCIAMKFAEDQSVVNQLWIVLNQHNRTKFLSRAMIYAILVQLLVLGFFNRLFCAIVVVILAFWLTQNKLPVKAKITWMVVTCTLALLQIFEPSTKFNYYGLTIGSVLWLVIYLIVVYPHGVDYIKRFDLKYKAATRYILLSPLVGFGVAVLNAFYVAYAFDSAMGHSDLNLVLSWGITGVAILLISAAPKGILTRFGHICGCLLVPYALMAVNIDLIFYGVLVVTLFYWMETEAKIHSSDLKNSGKFLEKLHFLVDFTKSTRINVSTLYRRTYFYLSLTVCYFFAIGNMASFNGFDPQWTRAYVATFNPFLMAALIIFKMVTPFFLITCAFYAIVLYSRMDDKQAFAVLLLFLDQMVLNFMLFIRNEGSWKEIGKSLSHFVVMEAMALVMLIFFGLARYVCSFRIGDPGTGYEENDFLLETGRFDVEDEDGAGGIGCEKIKKTWWYMSRCVYPETESSPSSQSSDSLLGRTPLLSPSLVSFYVEDSHEDFPIVPKVKSQEVQCRFEDEVKTSKEFKKMPDKEQRDMCSRSKTEIFQVGFDLGIAATLEHYRTDKCRRRKKSTFETKTHMFKSPRKPEEIQIDALSLSEKVSSLENPIASVESFKSLKTLTSEQPLEARSSGDDGDDKDDLERPMDYGKGDGTRNYKKIKKYWWKEFNSQTCVTLSNPCNPISNPKFPSSLLSFYVGAKPSSSHEVIKSDSQDVEVQCKFEDEVTFSKTTEGFRLKSNGTSSELSPKTKIGVQVSTIDLQTLKSSDFKSGGSQNVPHESKDIKKVRFVDVTDMTNVDLSEEWKPITLQVKKNPVYDLSYYDVFPTVDKIQAKELRDIYNKPFVFEEGYLNIGSQFNTTEEGENIGMISKPSYDDIDCHFYTTQYSETRVSVPKTGFQAHFVKRRYMYDFKRNRSVPHLETVERTIVSKIPSENDLSSRMEYERMEQQSEEFLDRTLNNQEELGNRLQKQLESVNISKAVYSTLNSGRDVSSKISIIRTESYFNANELEPAGSRIFRGSRTSFNSPDVLKLAPGLSREESMFYFMSDKQKANLLEKLLASDRPKTKYEHAFINNYFNELIKKAKDQEDPLVWTSSESSSASTGDDQDAFEVLHRQAVRNEKRRKREHRRKARELLAAAKKREEERLKQEKVLMKRAEKARKAEEARKLAAMYQKRKSTTELVPSQAIINLGETTRSEIKVSSSQEDEAILKLSITEGAIGFSESDSDEDRYEVTGGNEPRTALNVFKQISQKIPTFSSLLSLFNNDSFQEAETEEDSTDFKDNLPKPGNVPFRQPRQESGVTQPTQDQLDISKKTDFSTSSKFPETRTRRKRKYPGFESKSRVDRFYDDQQQLGKSRRRSVQCDGRHCLRPSSANATTRSTCKHAQRPVCDKYDKNVCVRKRPSERFLANVMEMSMILGNLPWSLSDMTEHIAKLPIRVVPGMLADGNFRALNPAMVSRLRSDSRLRFSPSEGTILEECESRVSNEDLPASPTSSKRQVARQSRRSTKSTLVKCHSDSTLPPFNTAVTGSSSTQISITEAATSDWSGWLKNQNRNSAKKDTAETVDGNQWSMLNLDNISRQFSPDTHDLCIESMPSNMLTESEQIDKLNKCGCPNNICICLKDLGLDEPRKTSLPIDVVLEVTGPVEEHQKSDSFHWFSDNDDSNNSHVEECPGSSRTPRFMQDATNPSKYLVKVESWLNQMGQQPEDVVPVDAKNTDSIFETINSLTESPDSSVNSDDLIRNESSFSEMKKQNNCSPQSKEVIDINDLLEISSVNDSLSMEIARGMLQEQEAFKHCSLRSLVEAQELVMFVLRCARNIKDRDSSNAYVNTDILPDPRCNIRDIKTQTVTPSTTTITTQAMSSHNCCVEVCTVQPPLSSVGSQMRPFQYPRKHRILNKHVQATCKMTDNHALTDRQLLKTTTNVGIQHSFSDVAVNTKSTSFSTRGVQFNGSEPYQTPINMPRKIFREVGLDPITPVCACSVDSPVNSNDNTSDDYACGLSTVREFHGPVDHQSSSDNEDTTQPQTAFSRTVENLRKAFNKKISVKVNTKKETGSSGEPGQFDEFQASSQLIKSEFLNENHCQSGEFHHNSYEQISFSMFKCPSKVSSPQILPPLEVKFESPGALGNVSSMEDLLDPSTLAEIPDIKNDSSRLCLTKRRTTRVSRMGWCPVPSPPKEYTNTYARIDACKPMLPALQAIAELKHLPNPRPKVKSVPRTDFAPLKEEHPQTAMILATLMQAAVTPTITTTVASMGVKKKKCSRNLTTKMRSDRKLLKCEQITEIIQRCRKLGMNYDEICKEIELEKVKRRSGK